MVKKQVTNGAKILTYFGLRRSIFSAICNMTSKPPLACNVADVTTTARMVNITSIAGLPGSIPKPKTRTIKPTPPSIPSAIPPFFAP